MSGGEEDEHEVDGIGRICHAFDGLGMYLESRSRSDGK